MAAKDVILKMNQEAEYNMKTQDFQGNDVKYLGEYVPVQIPKDKQDLIQEEFRRVSRDSLPTLRNIHLQQNLIDFQDRIYNRAQWYSNNANTCIQDSRNVAEVNHCCDIYIQQLRTNFHTDVMNILKDY